MAINLDIKFCTRDVYLKTAPKVVNYGDRRKFMAKKESEALKNYLKEIDKEDKAILKLISKVAKEAKKKK